MSEIIYSDKIYKIKRVKPRIINLFPSKLKKMNRHELLRFMVAYIFGYNIYLLLENNKEIGYCVISRGGSPRYPFAKKQDIIVGPYYIHPKYRGKKLSVFLVEKCLVDVDDEYNNAYDFIQKKNISSIKVTEAMGFERVFEGSYTKFTRKLKPVESGKGNFFIYKYVK